jgi:hypothetical protein
MPSLSAFQLTPSSNKYTVAKERVNSRMTRGRQHKFFTMALEYKVQ